MKFVGIVFLLSARLVDLISFMKHFLFVLNLSVQKRMQLGIFE